jgi:hypothetical protein
VGRELQRLVRELTTLRAVVERSMTARERCSMCALRPSSPWLCALLAIAALARCERASPPEHSLTFERAASELARCAFDEPSAFFSSAGARALESALRRAMREDRYRFAVRAGRCSSALPEPLRQRDPRASALFEAWESMLPLAQSSRLDEIALERAIRRVGVAWQPIARDPVSDVR